MIHRSFDVVYVPGPSQVQGLGRGRHGVSGAPFPTTDITGADWSKFVLGRRLTVPARGCELDRGSQGFKLPLKGFLESSLNPLVGKLTCDLCKEGLENRIKNLVIQWSQVKVSKICTRLEVSKR